MLEDFRANRLSPTTTGTFIVSQSLAWFCPARITCYCYTKHSLKPKYVVFKMEEKTFWELILHYGLFLGGIFQLICILAIVVVPSNQSVEDEGILQNKEDKLGKVHGQLQSVSQAQTRLRERRKKKWHHSFDCKLLRGFPAVLYQVCCFFSCDGTVYIPSCTEL